MQKWVFGAIGVVLVVVFTVISIDFISQPSDGREGKVVLQNEISKIAGEEIVSNGGVFPQHQNANRAANQNINAVEPVSPPSNRNTNTAVNTPLKKVTPKPKPAPKVQLAPKPAPKANTNTSTNSSASCTTGAFADQFLCLINNHRKAGGKNALKYSSAINAAATNHSKWMSETGEFSHTGENGSTFVERCAAEGVYCDAENIAWGFTSAKNLFDMWKNSPGHNANMLGNHTLLGLGVAGKYATTDFQ